VLILVDIQTDYWSQAPEIMEAFPHFEENVARVLHGARAAKIPVIHVRAQYDELKSPFYRQFKSLKRNAGKPTIVAGDHSEPFAMPLEGEHIISKPTW